MTPAAILLCVACWALAAFCGFVWWVKADGRFFVAGIKWAAIAVVVMWLSRM